MVLQGTCPAESTDKVDQPRNCCRLWLEGQDPAHPWQLTNTPPPPAKMNPLSSCRPGG